MKHLKRFSAVILAICMAFQLTACGVADTAKDTAEKAKDTAEKAADKAKEKAGQAKDQVVEWYEQIDFDKFKQGWDKAVDFAASTYSASMGSKYVKDVGKAINNMKVDINSAKGSARTVASEAGFAAEKWVAGTFNIDSVAGGSAYSATALNSNELGSPDIVTNYGESASLKYYKTGTGSNGSASQQATNYFEKYSEYAAKSKNPKDMEQYFNQYVKEGNEVDALYKSIYEGQTRIIPTNQLDEARKYLDGNIKKLNTSKMNAVEAQRYQETLDNLKDRLTAPDGTQSKPLSYDDCIAITELAQEGKIDLLDEKYEKLGITPAQIITPKYIVKQSINAGLTSAALNTVFTIGPDIFTILKEAAKNGNFDEAQLKQVGVDGLLAGSEGFVEGSVSCAILTACQAGKFGTNLTNASPEVIGTLTVLAIDAIRYGYALSKGEITALDYSNLMTEEIVVAIVSQASGAALQMLLPAVPFAYMTGCMAGGMLATAGLQTVKDMVMEVKDGGGFEAIVPANTVQTMNVITDKISDLHITDQLSGFKDTVISTANNGYITIKSKVS